MRRLLFVLSLLFQLYSRAQQVDTAYEFPAQTRIKGIVWTTCPQKGGLSCYIENTDTTITRNLYVFYQQPDSMLMIHIQLDSAQPYKFAFFNLYPGDKRLYLTEDTTFLASQFITDTGQGSPMAAAIVTKRIDKRAEMDHRYTNKFSEPTLLSFETFGEPYSDIGSFLRAKAGRLQGGYSPSDTPKDFMGHKVFFYWNEQNMSWPM